MDRPDFEPDPSFGQPALSMQDFLTNIAKNPPEPEEAKPIEQPQEDVTEFDGDIAQELVGILELGKLQRTFDLFGHTLVMRTTKAAEDFAIAKVIEKYMGTIAQGRAYAAACVGASIVSIDGKDPLAPLGPDIYDHVEARFNLMISKWDDVAIDEAFACYQTLLERKAEVYEFLRKKSTARVTSSTSS